MIRKFFSLWLAAVALISMPQTSAIADPPSIFSMFRKMPAENDLVLKDIHGPWLIYAYTFTGQDAEKNARQLALELRQTTGLKTFVHAKNFDYNKELGSQRVTADGRTFKVRPMNEQITSGVAVLVGEFDSVDHPAIQEKLKELKYIHPKCLQKETDDVNGDKKLESGEVVEAYRRWMWKGTDDEKRKNKGPMGTAFITRNPLLPEEFFQGPKVDSFIADINRGAQYSLLENPKRYTVRIATFPLSRSISLGENDKKGELTTNEKNHQLQAERANRLASKLREKGVEAYEFHDRYCSMVTVGSFDSLGNTDNTGKFIYDQGIIETMNLYCGVKKYEQTSYGTAPVPKTLDGIAFDLEAKPIAVPRAETRSIYSGSLLGR